MRGEPVDECRKLRRKRRVDTELPAPRPGETQAVGMQEHPREAEGAQGLVEGRIAVLLIARHRMTHVCRVYADLVRSSRVQGDFHERRGAAEELDRSEVAH